MSELVSESVINIFETFDASASKKLTICELEQCDSHQSEYLTVLVWFV